MPRENGMKRRGKLTIGVHLPPGREMGDVEWGCLAAAAHQAVATELGCILNTPGTAAAVTVKTQPSWGGEEPPCRPRHAAPPQAAEEKPLNVDALARQLLKDFQEAAREIYGPQFGLSDFDRLPEAVRSQWSKFAQKVYGLLR